MSDLVTVLTERLEAIADAHRPLSCGRALAREALAFVAEQLPTREEIARILGHSQMLRENEWQQADALLRDLRGRLGVR